MRPRILTEMTSVFICFRQRVLHFTGAFYFLLIQQFLIHAYFGKNFLKDKKKMLMGVKCVSNIVFLSLPIK